MENLGARNVKILFFHSFHERRWRDKVATVFSEKIHPPLLAAVDPVFFPLCAFSRPILFLVTKQTPAACKFPNENNSSEVKSSQLRAHVVSISLIIREKPS